MGPLRAPKKEAVIGDIIFLFLSMFLNIWYIIISFNITILLLIKLNDILSLIFPGKATKWGLQIAKLCFWILLYIIVFSIMLTLPMKRLLSSKAQ